MIERGVMIAAAMFAGCFATLVAAESERAVREADGTVRITPLPIDAALRNAWPVEEEAAFQRRVQHVLAHFEQINAKGKYGNTFFENEKRSYARAMFDVLAGRREGALKFLQERDNLADDNAHTLGIDYYPCFTLKQQMRKYFFFGPYLDQAYRRKMYDAAKIWTEHDPHRRPHPKFGQGDGEPGWRPQNRGGWVDVRSTDNLKAMRDTSVYLMAEETGNEATRAQYERIIAAHVTTLYHVGMSEWDSETYLGHGIAPYLNLYDFAKSRRVKSLAKAALDWFATAAAVKYYRGGWGGPCKRDYGGANVVFGASAAQVVWLWFGDTPQPPTRHIDEDALHVITSAYRPPMAVVALARKRFDRPVTLHNTKPPYGKFDRDAVDAPAYWETMHYGRTYQLGSVASKLSGDVKGLDVGPMKFAAHNTRRGVDFFIANTAPGGAAPTMISSSKHPGDQIAQAGPMLMWLRRNATVEEDVHGVRFVFQMPRSAKLEHDGGVTIVRFEKTWIALLRLNLGPMHGPASIEGKRADHYADERLWHADVGGPGYAGFALIVGGTDGVEPYAQSKRRVATEARLDTARLLKEGIVELHDGTGRWMRVFHNRHSDRPGVLANGVDRKWDEQFDVYRTAGNGAIISLGWKEGTLRVEAGGAVFEQTVTADGQMQSR